MNLRLRYVESISVYYFHDVIMKTTPIEIRNMRLRLLPNFEFVTLLRRYIKRPQEAFKNVSTVSKLSGLKMQLSLWCCAQIILEICGKKQKKAWPWIIYSALSTTNLKIDSKTIAKHKVSMKRSPRRRRSPLKHRSIYAASTFQPFVRLKSGLRMQSCDFHAQGRMRPLPFRCQVRGNMNVATHD